MEAGTLVAWHKDAGQTVHRGDIIAEVETDKGIIDVEVFTDGVIEQIVVPVGEKVPVGTVLARIREAARTAVQPELTQAPRVAERPPVPVRPPASPAQQSTKVAASQPRDVTRLPMSPSARRLARQLGVDPYTVKGTGPGGAITREDIQQAAAATAPAAIVSAVSPPPAAVPDRTNRMRAAIAAAMARSKREIPHYYLSTTIDFHASETWLAEANIKRPITERLLYGVLFIRRRWRSLGSARSSNGPGRLATKSSRVR